jgi:hypothetical protein
MPDDGNGDLDPDAVAELRRLARSRPRSGREAVAKASALLTLERLRRGKRQVPPMPEDWYPLLLPHPSGFEALVWIAERPEVDDPSVAETMHACPIWLEGAGRAEATTWRRV